MAERFASVSEDELCQKCIIKQLLNSVFAWQHEFSKPRGLCYLPSASADNTDLGFDNSWYHAKTEFNNCFIIHFSHNSSSETEATRSAILFLRRTLHGLSNQADVGLDMINAIKMMRSQRLLQGWHNVIYLKQYFGWPDQPSSGLDVTT